MPLYDYQCSDCDNIQEEMHPMSGPVDTIECTSCGKHNMHKCVSVVNGVVINTQNPTKSG